MITEIVEFDIILFVVYNSVAIFQFYIHPIWLPIAVFRKDQKFNQILVVMAT